MSGWRTVIIENRSKLDLKLNNICVRRENETKLINISEVDNLILETTSISITAALMCELIKQKVKVIFCDEKFNPHFELIPYYGSHDCVTKIKMQFNWNDFIKENVWSLIVYEKIKNQMLLLKKFQKEEYKILEKYLCEIELNDETNREGHAAKVYFNALFGKSFSRKNENSINSALNYGYQILLSQFNKEVINNGYLTQLGINHKNQYNFFNFSSDLMEPFRPIIDELVYNQNFQKFKTEEKRIVQEILEKKLKINDENHYLSECIRIYTKSILNAFEFNNYRLIRFFEYEL
ncbi:type II CRISPR-associated endonuclease Cas1 [Caviibacter abscessus]|uniref:type II CRISPR-associated endonuclease Cas1 n=1 Tax=Caviibacter abscessus TaxID=1766719 RepID=UPI00082C04C6|nr:type II CRISPR-associated endonuclease Cas1 [Caviibacter abscessus]